MDTQDALQVEPSPGGISRRTLIRRAAIAGVAAWTVPVVVESLTAPAGALTIGAGCYRMWVEFTAGGAAWPAWQSTAPADGTCDPSGSCTPTASTAAAAGVAISPLAQPVNGSATAVTISIPAETNCTIVGASAWVIRGGSNQCAARTTNGTSNGVAFAFAAGGVTLTPVGNVSGSSNDTFWDNSGSVRSFIGVVIRCT